MIPPRRGVFCRVSVASISLPSCMGAEVKDRPLAQRAPKRAPQASKRLELSLFTGGKHQWAVGQSRPGLRVRDGSEDRLPDGVTRSRRARGVQRQQHSLLCTLQLCPRFCKQKRTERGAIICVSLHPLLHGCVNAEAPRCGK